MADGAPHSVSNLDALGGVAFDRWCHAVRMGGGCADYQPERRGLSHCPLLDLDCFRYQFVFGISAQRGRV